jgi:hypothetical protein
MRIRKFIVAAAAAVVLGTTGALVAPALASAQRPSHTLTFTAVNTASTSPTEYTRAGQGTDVNSEGTTIGFDVIYETLTAREFTANATFSTTGGLLYATIYSTDGGQTFSGKVTGGTGVFDRATGTATAETISSSKTAVTIIYR